MDALIIDCQRTCEPSDNDPVLGHHAPKTIGRGVKIKANLRARLQVKVDAPSTNEGIRLIFQKDLEPFQASCNLLDANLAAGAPEGLVPAIAAQHWSKNGLQVIVDEGCNMIRIAGEIPKLTNG